MKKTLISLLLFSSTTVFANSANFVDDASCANIVNQAYEKSIERESGFLASASKAVEDVGTSLANNFGGTASCLKNAMNGAVGINVGVPGMDQIIQQVTKQIDSQIASACNKIVNQAKSTIQNSVGKYATSQNLFSSDYFSGIKVNSSIR